MVAQLRENRGVNPSLTAHFQLEGSDVQAFQRYASGDKGKQLSPMQTLLALFAGVVIMGFFFYLSLPKSPATRPIRATPSASSPLFSVLSLFLPMLFFVGFWLFLISAGKKSNKKSPILQHPSTFTLSNEELRVEFDSTTVTNRWAGVSRVENTAIHLFLFTQPADGFIVPRRAFNSDDEFVRFCEFAHQKSEAAKPLAPETPPIARV